MKIYPKNLRLKWIFKKWISGVFDPVTKSWSALPLPPNSSWGSCFVSWRGLILRIGSYYSMREVWKFDPSTEAWILLSSSSPLDLFRSGCMVLPNQNILVTGTASFHQTFNYKAFTIFNVTADTWTKLKFSAVDLYDSVPLALGSRIFVLPVATFPIMLEYNLGNNTMSTLTAPVTARIERGFATAAVPTQWFSHWAGGCTGVE
jgi:hypothetical protein